MTRATPSIRRILRFALDRALTMLLSAVCWTIPLGRLFNVPIRVHWASLIFPVGIGLWGSVEPWRGTRSVLAFAFFGLLGGSLLVHEFAHVLVARRYGCRTESVVFIPFGCVALLRKIPRGTGELWMALAGPVSSALLALLFALPSLLWQPATGSPGWYLVELMRVMCVVNLILAVFNLLPFYPMDGGRVLRSLGTLSVQLILRKDALSAQLVATRVAVRYVGRLLALGGCLLTVLQTRFWPHLILIALLILAGESEYWLIRRKARRRRGRTRKNSFLAARSKSRSDIAGVRPVGAPGLQQSVLPPII